MFLQKLSQKNIPLYLQVLLEITCLLACIGLLIGIPLLIFNLNLPSLNNLEFETKEYWDLSLRYLFRFLGTIFSGLGIISLISFYLTHNKYRIGWGMLVALYLGGFSFSVMLLGYWFIKWSNLPIFPVFILFPIALGIFGLVVLFQKETLKFIFNKKESIID